MVPQDSNCVADSPDTEVQFLEKAFSFDGEQATRKLTDLMLALQDQFDGERTDGKSSDSESNLDSSECECGRKPLKDIEEADGLLLERVTSADRSKRILDIPITRE